MLINGMVFLITLSKDSRIFTTEHVTSCIGKQLASSLTKILNIYCCGRFIVQVILMGMVFEPLSDIFKLVTVNTMATHEHISKIERGIWTIKDRAQCTISELSSDVILPKEFNVHLVALVIFGLIQYNGEIVFHSPFHWERSSVNKKVTLIVIME